MVPQAAAREEVQLSKGGKKCVLRKESNGKILLRNQGTEACKPDDAFDCPDYDFLLDKFVNQD